MVSESPGATQPGERSSADPGSAVRRPTGGRRATPNEAPFIGHRIALTARLGTRVLPGSQHCRCSVFQPVIPHCSRRRATALRAGRGGARSGCAARPACRLRCGEHQRWLQIQRSNSVRPISWLTRMVPVFRMNLLQYSAGYWGGHMMARRALASAVFLFGTASAPTSTFGARPVTGVFRSKAARRGTARCRDARRAEDVASRRGLRHGGCARRRRAGLRARDLQGRPIAVVSSMIGIQPSPCFRSAGGQGADAHHSGTARITEMNNP